MIIVKRTDLDVDALAGVNYEPLELEPDGFDWREVQVEKPWGHETERFHDDRCSITWLHIRPNQMTSMHCHTKKTVVIYIMGGLGTLETLSRSYRVSSGNIAVIEPGAFHRIRSNAQPVVLYEIESPPNKRNLVRLADSYGRGQGYARGGAA